MNAVEIEEAVSKLMEAAYDAAEFLYAFLEAFGNKSTTIRKLRTTAHDRNDETLERIYIGRRFKNDTERHRTTPNDTERLETLFRMYTEMTSKEAKA